MVAFWRALGEFGVALAGVWGNVGRIWRGETTRDSNPEQLEAFHFLHFWFMGNFPGQFLKIVRENVWETCPGNVRKTSRTFLPKQIRDISGKQYVFLSCSKSFSTVLYGNKSYLKTYPEPPEICLLVVDRTCLDTLSTSFFFRGGRGGIRGHGREAKPPTPLGDGWTRRDGRTNLFPLQYCIVLLSLS